jgi:hypothetical protein
MPEEEVEEVVEVEVKKTLVHIFTKIGVVTDKTLTSGSRQAQRVARKAAGMDHAVPWNLDHEVT